MKKKNLVWIIVFVGIVLVGTTWLIDANADDTYNFYFQKAPGPTVVNQGAAGPTNPSDIKIKDGLVVTSQTPAAPVPAAPVSTTPAATAPDEAPGGYRNWELSLGVGGSQFSPGTPEATRYWEVKTQSGIINEAQYSAGLQYNVTENFGLYGEAFYLAKSHTYKALGVEKVMGGSRFDFGAGLAITPFRLRMGGGIKLNVTALLGGMSLPITSSQTDPENARETIPKIGHAGAFVYGARGQLEFGSRLAFALTVRKVTHFDATHGVAALTYLF